MQVTNNSKAPQGVHTLRGVVFIKPGETKELDLGESQAERAGRLKFLDLKGKVSEAVAIPLPLGQTIDIPPNEIDQLRQQIEAKDAEIKRLSELLAERDAEIATLKEAAASSGLDSPKGPFEVKETSPGWYGVFGADGKQIGKNMRADDAEAFKAMNQAEQEQLLTK